MIAANEWDVDAAHTYLVNLGGPNTRIVFCAPEDQDRWERRDWWGVVVDSPDPEALARFWSELLGWPLWRPEEMDPGEAAIDAGEGVAGITFHRKDDYVRPVWPSAPGEQQMALHLDFQVDDLEREMFGHERAFRWGRDHGHALLDR